MIFISVLLGLMDFSDIVILYRRPNKTYLTWAFLEPSVIVVAAPMIMKFGIGIKLDVFYTMVTKKFVTSLPLRNYDVITYILAHA